MVVASDQLILTATGELTQASDTKDCSIFWWTGKEFSTVKVKEVKKSNKKVHSFTSAQGRLISCPYDTSFMGRPHNPKYSIINYNNIDLDTISTPGVFIQTLVAVLGHLNVFGKLEYDDNTLGLLRSSFDKFQDKRPNQYTKVSVASSFSKLTKRSLKKILSTFLKYKIMKHLTPRSKDILFFLSSRLGLRVNGHSVHSPLEQPGTLKIKGPLSEGIRYESLRYFGKLDVDSVEIIPTKPTSNLLIGSFICLTN